MRRILVTAGVALCWLSGVAVGQTPAMRPDLEGLANRIASRCVELGWRCGGNRVEMNYILTGDEVHVETNAFGQFTLSLSVGFGEKAPASVVLASCNFYGESWVFLKKAQFRVDGEFFEFPDRDPSHDVGYRQVSERIAFAVDYDFVTKVSKSKNAIVGINGEKGVCQFDLQPVDKSRFALAVEIAKSLDDFKRLGGSIEGALSPNAMNERIEARREEISRARHGAEKKIADERSAKEAAEAQNRLRADEAHREAEEAQRVADEREAKNRKRQCAGKLKISVNSSPPINGKPQPNWMTVEVTNPTDHRVEEVVVVLSDKEGEVGRGKIKIVNAKSKGKGQVKVIRTKGLTAKVESIHLPD